MGIQHMGAVCNKSELADCSGVPLTLTIESIDFSCEVSVTVNSAEIVEHSLQRELPPHWGAGNLRRLLFGGQELKTDDGVTWDALMADEAAVLRADWHAYEALTDDTIYEAVVMWCAGGTTKDEAHWRWGAIEAWNVSEVTSMQRLFKDQTNFNDNISEWDVSNVTDTSWLFSGARSFNKPLEKWIVGKITCMRFMFYGACEFNQPLEKWDVSQVKDMTGEPASTCASSPLTCCVRDVLQFALQPEVFSDTGCRIVTPFCYYASASFAKTQQVHDLELLEHRTCVHAGYGLFHREPSWVQKKVQDVRKTDDFIQISSIW